MRRLGGALNLVVRRRALTLLLFGCVGAALMPGVANAAEFRVTRTDDAGGCVPGNCSLRGAIIEAHFSSGPSTIVLPPGTYTLTIPRGAAAPYPDRYDGDLDIDGNVTIRNPQAAGLYSGQAVINANGQTIHDRALHIQGNVTLRGVSVSGGVAPADGTANRHGGGIRVGQGSSLTMRDGLITGNSATDIGALGGGLYSDRGTVSLERVVVEANTTHNPNPEITGGFGGGIYAEPGGITTVADSVLRMNQAAFGGAISGAGFRVARTSIRRNQSFGPGGAGFLRFATSTFENTSINHNSAGDGSGGALRVRDATAILESVTVTQNTAPIGGGFSVTETEGNQAGVAMTHTILAGNRDDPSGLNAPDCVEEPIGQVTSQGSNIIGNVNGCAFPHGPSDKVGTSASPIDALLTGDAYFGGAITNLFTLGLRPGSPAINTGSSDSADCQVVDARGVPRERGGRCDIGAYELVKCGGVVVNRVGGNGADKATDERLAPTAGADGVIGLPGDDALRGDNGADGLCGDRGRDVLRGEAGDDQLIGGRGDDQLIGGPGRDTCVGGEGNDSAQGCEVKRGIP